MCFKDEIFNYHFETKHSYSSVRNDPNRLDWDHQPEVFKSYEKYEKISLNIDIESHDFLYHIAGINARKIYSTAQYFLRMNPSAGALYPNEIYFQSRNNAGIKDGVYHLDIKHSAIRLLKPISDDGLEVFFSNKQFDGFIFLISSIYYRSSWKYKNRAFRYCLLDGGHILGSMEAGSYLFDKYYEIVYNFKKKKLNKLFNFDSKEFFQSAVLVGEKTSKPVNNIELNLPIVDGVRSFEKNELIEKAYKDSINLFNPKEQHKKPYFFYKKDFFKNTIINRRSIREFSQHSIKADEFKKIINILNNPITSDCDEEVEIYAVINRVQGMPLGLYKDSHYIKEGDFKKKAGYLCLEQELGASSAATFFLTTKSKNYQAAYQKAGVIGHRLYLAANYLGYGCSGIGAYYDDEVSEFLEDKGMVLYALAIGG